MIIIGIGSDDVLLFHDVWSNAKTIPALKNQPVLRLTYTFWLSARAMLLTSLTSTVAFLISSASPIKPLKAYGYFASLLVPLDFLLTIMMQPATFYIYETCILAKWNSLFGNEQQLINDKLE